MSESTTDLIDRYRAVRDQMLAHANAKFPPGTRVQPVGVTTGNWGATVVALDECDRRRMSADTVFLDWDNGNKFSVPIDEIEPTGGGR